MNPIRILLADDMTLIRHGIRVLMHDLDDIVIVGEAATADEAIRLARELTPQAVLMDQDLPGDGLRATRAIKEAHPDIEIIVMTDRLDHDKALRAIEAGASGYILKDIPTENLAGAIRSVCNGRGFFNPGVARKLLERLGQISREQRLRARMEVEGLTTRELDILVELARGATDREIAAKFVVAPGTIKTHIRNILRKLKARNRTQAVAYVLRRGLID